VCSGLLAAGVAGCAPPAAGPDAANAGCVGRLLVPRYPRIASSARLGIEGLRVKVRVNPDGAVQSVAFDTPRGAENAAKLFTASIEEDVRGSTFRAGCQDRDIELTFDFRLSERFETDGRAAFRAPGHVEIFDSRPVVD